MEKIAVVILNWNGAEMLRTFLPTLLACSPEAAIYVADNGSSDESCELVRDSFPQVNLIRLNENFGFAEGYNRALLEVEAEYYLLLNSDVEVTEKWLRPLMDHLDEHPEVAACQPKILSYHSKERFEYAGACGGYIDRYGYPFCRGRIMGTLEEDKGQYDTVAELFWASGAALCIRAADFWGVGGFDGRFFAHMEEIDLCWRLNSRGRKVTCVPQSRVYHVGGATLKRESPRKTYLNFRNNLLMLYKNLEPKRAKRVFRVRFWLDWMAVCQFLLQGNLASAKAVRSARRDFKQLVPEFASDRNKNLANAKEAQYLGLLSRSILWLYYIKRIRRFRDLKF